VTEQDPEEEEGGEDEPQVPLTKAALLQILMDLEEDNLFLINNIQEDE